MIQIGLKTDKIIEPITINNNIMILMGGRVLDKYCEPSFCCIILFTVEFEEFVNRSQVKGFLLLYKLLSKNLPARSFQLQKINAIIKPRDIHGVGMRASRQVQLAWAINYLAPGVIYL